jgi:hypothetical protein
VVERRDQSRDVELFKTVFIGNRNVCLRSFPSNRTISDESLLSPLTADGALETSNGGDGPYADIRMSNFTTI